MNGLGGESVAQTRTHTHTQLKLISCCFTGNQTTYSRCYFYKIIFFFFLLKSFNPN